MGSSPDNETFVSGRSREKRRIFDIYHGLILGTISIAAGIIVWKVAAIYTHRFFLVGPLETIYAVKKLYISGELLYHLSLSGQEFLYGFVISAVIGVALGFLMAMSKHIEALLDPWVSIFNAIPRLALGPLLILWLGIGIISKIALVFLGAVFPILINTYVGVKTVDEQLRQAALAFGATRWEEFRTILIPGALPHILSGFRLGSARAILGVLVGEFFGSRGGIGNMIFMSAQLFETDKMLVGVLTFGVAGLVIVSFMQFLERRFAPWRLTTGVE
jgi:NitT/TauT family transport system permease protein